MGDVAILHAEDSRRLACRLAAELAAEGHSVARREAALPSSPPPGEAAAAADAVIVVWSAGLIADKTMIDAARRALARRALAPVRVGDAEPPASFRHLWPIDLDGWAGDASDPRWQFVRDEVALAMRRSELALTRPAEPPARTQQAVARAGRGAPGLSTASSLARVINALPPRAIPAAAASIALCAGAMINAASRPPRTAPLTAPLAAALDAAPTGEGAAAPAPMIALIRPSAAFAEEDPATDDMNLDLQTDAITEPSSGVMREPAALRLATLEIEPDAPEPDAPELETPELEEPGPQAEEPVLPDDVPTAEDAPIVARAAPPAPQPDMFAGAIFRDCLACPDMAELPSPSGGEGPALAMSRREISYDEWRACVGAGACRPVAAPAGAAGAARGRLPVVNISFEDALSYAAWLSTETGRVYRLPTEDEWAFAARGDDRETGGQNASQNASETANVAGAAWGALLPTGSFPSSAYGLFDMSGNAAEWTSGCAVGEAEPCAARIVMGGSFSAAAQRAERRAGARAPDLGFRVLRDGS